MQYGSEPNAYSVPVDTYAMLCARSATRKAGNLARENQLTANGYDLVEMTVFMPENAEGTKSRRELADGRKTGGMLYGDVGSLPLPKRPDKALRAFS
ncbi:MAG: hypothetical protein KGZ53_04720 [Peptococcaceae bacterium]|nr:hypothetical protein [Peptococcaceae bacterium]